MLRILSISRAIRTEIDAIGYLGVQSFSFGRMCPYAAALDSKIPHIGLNNLYSAATSVDGLLVVRWLAHDALQLRQAYGAFWSAFRQLYAGWVTFFCCAKKSNPTYKIYY